MDGVKHPQASAKGAQVRARILEAVHIGLFDIAGPIVVQGVARDHGASMVLSLVISGLPPAVWILATAVWRRRIDAIGLLVLGGILLSSLVGLLSGNSKLYLIDGALITGAFGVMFLLSLLGSRPIMFHLALAGQGGPDSPRGKDFADLWQYPGFRRSMNVMTIVWGAGFVLQAVVLVAIVMVSSVQEAFLVSKILPYACIALLIAWTVIYGIRAQRRGKAAEAARRAAEPAEAGVSPAE